MILIEAARCLRGESVQIELPRPNMIIDPRPCNYEARKCRFQVVYHENGTTVMLTRTDKEIYYWIFMMRVYDPAAECVPDFDSTIYNYMGVDGEQAPLETTALLIDPSVEIIKKDSFRCCNKIKKCIMHDGVHTIEYYAFNRCTNMKVVKLSRALKHIGQCAFLHCFSLEGLFLPPSVEEIETHAFETCKNIRILPLPLNIDIAQLGIDFVYGCYTFFRLTQIRRYHYRDSEEIIAHAHWSMLDFYRNLPPLHKACLNTNVTAQIINDSIATHGLDSVSAIDHDGMTPLHILEP